MRKIGDGRGAPSGNVGSCDFRTDVTGSTGSFYGASAVPHVGVKELGAQDRGESAAIDVLYPFTTDEGIARRGHHLAHVMHDPDQAPDGHPNRPWT